MNMLTRWRVGNAASSGGVSCTSRPRHSAATCPPKRPLDPRCRRQRGRSAPRLSFRTSTYVVAAAQLDLTRTPLSTSHSPRHTHVQCSDLRETSLNCSIRFPGTKAETCKEHFAAYRRCMDDQVRARAPRSLWGRRQLCGGVEGSACAGSAACAVEGPPQGGALVTSAPSAHRSPLFAQWHECHAFSGLDPLGHKRGNRGGVGGEEHSRAGRRRGLGVRWPPVGQKGGGF
jgi:hypothetical protein